MTDVRFRQQLNSLVKINRRNQLDALTPKPPVLGGVGNAGASDPQQIAEDKYYVAAAFSVYLCGIPDVSIPTERVLNSGPDPLWTMAISRDIYTAYRRAGITDAIQKNGGSFISGGLSGIDGMTGNTNEVIVYDDPTTAGTIKFFERIEGTLLDTYANTAPWQVEGAGSIGEALSANDTRWSISVTHPSDFNHLQGFWLYDRADNSQVAFIALPKGGSTIIESRTAFTATRWYTWNLVGVGGFIYRVTVYDLDGNQLGTQDIDTTGWFGGFPPRNIDVTEFGMWFVRNANEDLRVGWIPKIDASELFDPAGFLEVSINSGGVDHWYFGSKDRNFTLEY